MMNDALSDPLSLTKVAKQSPRDQITSMAKTGEQEQLATSNLGKLESQKNIDVAKIKAAETGRQAEGATADLGQAREQLAATPEPEFKPSQETFIGMSTLAGLIAFVGSSAGKYGSQSGRAAIESMTGMMKGYQTGRQDVFRREQIQFEKELQTIKAKNEKIYKQLELAEKTRAIDSAKGNSLAAIAIAESESPLLRAKFDKQGLTETVKLQKEIFDATMKMEKMAQDLQLSKAKATTTGGPLPKDKDTNNIYLARKSVINNITDIESLLKDPKYARLIGPETQFTPDVINNLRANFPELSQKLARIQAIEFEIGGKNLTKSEQSVLSPIYGWKGIPVSALKERIKGVKDDFTDKNAFLEMRYPGFIPIGEKIDQYYQQRGKSITDVSEIGGTGEKIATKDDVAVTAAKNNISIDEAKSRLKARGYQIEGE